MKKRRIKISYAIADCKGSADECKKLLDKGLKHDKNVVLDRYGRKIERILLC
jgi:hypothetical protein